MLACLASPWIVWLKCRSGVLILFAVFPLQLLPVVFALPSPGPQQDMFFGDTPSILFTSFLLLLQRAEPKLLPITCRNCCPVSGL